MKIKDCGILGGTGNYTIIFMAVIELYEETAIVIIIEDPSNI